MIKSVIIMKELWAYPVGEAELIYIFFKSFFLLQAM